MLLSVCGSSKSAVADQQPHSKATLRPRFVADVNNDGGYSEICETNRTILRSDEIIPKEINRFVGRNDNFLALVSLFTFCCCLEPVCCLLHT